MIILVKAVLLYNSRGGNTEQVAQKIAEGLGAESFDHKHIPRLDEYDLIVVGTWVIMGKISSAGKRYLKKLKRKGATDKKFALFITSGAPEDPHPSIKDDTNPKTIQEVIFNRMEKIITKINGATILKKRFYCKGCLRIWGQEVDYKGHPSEEELAQAKDFGEQLKKHLK